MSPPFGGGASAAEFENIESQLAEPVPAGARVSEGDGFSWWLVVVGLLVVWMGILILFSDNYRQAFDFIIPRGIWLTVQLTIIAFVASTFFGLLLGLGRLSKNVVWRTISTTYIEFVRGVPVIVLIFLVALVIIPQITDLLGVKLTIISLMVRGIISLTIIYAAFIAEVFRAGIQSVSHGQIEAGQSVGLTDGQIMRKIILPQAIRNILPALGNDLIALFKDTALVSVLAVNEITQLARLYTGSSFRFREGFLIITFFYLIVTILLSLALRWYERRIAIPEK